jgi:hypothetical protein
LLSIGQQPYKENMWMWECEHELMIKNGFFGIFWWHGQNIFRISLCHVRMMWKIFLHMYMDESKKGW